MQKDSLRSIDALVVVFRYLVNSFLEETNFNVGIIVEPDRIQSGECRLATFFPIQRNGVTCLVKKMSLSERKRV